MAMHAPKRTSSSVGQAKIGRGSLQKPVNRKSVNVSGCSDFHTSLDEWHSKKRSTETGIPEAAVNPKKVLLRKTSTQRVHTAPATKIPARQTSTELPRVASCASSPMLYQRKTGIANSPRQPSLKTPRTPIQQRQPPWKQGSGDDRPKPCVSPKYQRRIISQRSSLAVRLQMKRDDDPVLDIGGTQSPDVTALTEVSTEAYAASNGKQDTMHSKHTMANTGQSAGMARITSLFLHCKHRWLLRTP